MKKVGIKDCESVADHSFRMALLGVHFSVSTGLDQSKVLRMCLIHDLAESRIGDLMPEDKISEAAHREEENRTILEIFSTLPENTKDLLTGDWQELLDSKTRESKVVWMLDKLEMGLQAKEYAENGHGKLKLRQFDPSKKLDKEMAQILDDYLVHEN
jgi:putative hydrolase of HD superfamily